jgi:hypothetical protein
MQILESCVPRSSNLPPSNIFLRGHAKPLAEINRDLLQAAALRASDHGPFFGLSAL